MMVQKIHDYVSISDEKTFNIRGQGRLNEDTVQKIKRRIQKGSSNNFPKIQQFSTDVDIICKNDDGNYV